ncbi:MAG: outer membrane beta-barrel protein [Candidatus Eisenbacteria bacterium]|nr:outer membrane beta-barrel protein [Candidatus Eisenbacteria bacterium]
MNCCPECRAAGSQVLRRGAVCGAGMLALLALSPAAGAGQDWEPDGGFQVGLALQTDIIGADDPAGDVDPNTVFIDEVGAGIGLHIGYAFTPSFALRLNVGAAGHDTNQDDLTAVHASSLLEAHWRFVTGTRMRPYLLLGLGAGSMRVESEIWDSEISGGVAAFGGGFLYSFSRHLALDMSARLHLINWDTVKLTAHLPGGDFSSQTPVDEEGSAGKLQAGLVWDF